MFYTEQLYLSKHPGILDAPAPRQSEAVSASDLTIQKGLLLKDSRLVIPDVMPKNDTGLDPRWTQRKHEMQRTRKTTSFIEDLVEQCDKCSKEG